MSLGLNSLKSSNTSEPSGPLHYNHYEEEKISPQNMLSSSAKDNHSPNSSCTLDRIPSNGQNSGSQILNDEEKITLPSFIQTDYACRDQPNLFLQSPQFKAVISEANIPLKKKNKRNLALVDFDDLDRGSLEPPEEFTILSQRNAT